MRKTGSALERSRFPLFSVPFALLALYQLDDTGSPQTVRAQGQKILRILHGGNAAGSLDLYAGAHVSGEQRHVLPGGSPVEKPVEVLI